MKFKNEWHRKHFELWIWLSENPELDKRNWPEWVENVGEEISRTFCFACEQSYGDCYYCPIDWECLDCGEGSSIYKYWEIEKNLEKRSIMAEVIAHKEWNIK